MNKMFIIVCLLAIGCKANVSEPNTAANAPKVEEKKAAVTKPTFTECASSAGHFVWDESKKAYNYVTSPEAKQFYSESWDKAKAAASSAYDSAVQSYHESLDSDEKTEEKK